MLPAKHTVELPRYGNDGSGGGWGGEVMRPALRNAATATIMYPGKPGFIDGLKEG